MAKRFRNLCWISLMAASQVALAQQYSITTVAGGAPPPTPAAAASTSIGQPNRVMVDGSGNVYISSLNCVFKMNSSGSLTLIAGNSRPGFSGDGGPATQAQLNAPQGMALDQFGNLYIADSKNNRVRIVNSKGIINTFAGTGMVSPGGAGTYGDLGLAVNALLHLPAGVAVDKSGNVYIADTGDNLIREVTTDGLINSIAGDSYPSYLGDGFRANTSELHSPEDVAVDSSGNVYISDSANAVIREITASTGIINFIAGNVTAAASGAITGTPNIGYSGDGAAANLAGLVTPFGLTVDSSGQVYFAENGDSRIRMINTKGIISTIAGNGTAGFSGDGSTGTTAEVNFPTGVAVDSSGNVYIADLVNLRVRKLTSGGTISTVAGNGIYSYSGDNGQATAAQLNTPQAVATDSSGNFYIADTANHVVRKVTAAGVISTIAGNGTAGSGGDGGAATSAQLRDPQGIAVDASGNVYVSDTQNARVRKISGGTINTVAGSGTAGYGGDGGAATSAQLNVPAGLAVDSSNNLYIADFSNNRVRKVTPGGTITTLAGNGLAGYGGDGGPATGAQLSTPVGLATDSSGNVYIADTGNNAIRVVNSSGIISTVAGNGLAGYSGDGGEALLAMVGSPTGVAVDSAGNLYISDGSLRIRKVYSSGFINTIAGDGARGYTGDGGVAPFASMNGPTGIALALNGNLYVADSGNSAIRELLLGGFQLKIAAVANSASSLAGPVVGGEIVSLYGTGIGPAAGVVYTPGANGQLPQSLAGTTVYFGNYAAPLFYVSANQISAIVPYEVSGSQVQVFVEYNGNLSATFPVSLATAVPAIFASATGQAAAINLQANGGWAYNSAANPLNAGDYVELYLTGTGQTKPPSVDGQLTPDANELVPATVTVTIGGKVLTPSYAGGAPGSVAGLTQVNVQIPSGLPAGAVPVTVQVGSVSTQPGVTIAVSGK